jgi:phospholipase/carboxylesterase
MIPSLVIFLHGVGSRGADLAALGHHWVERLPGATFVAPDGPAPFNQGGAGRQWFSVSGVTPANRSARIVDARADFDRVIGGIVSEHDFANRLDRVAFVGFSQGSIMALDAVVSGRWPIGAVLAFAGRLASPEPFAHAQGETRFLLVHGTADPVMPFAEATDAQRRLSQSGREVRVEAIAGLGHSTSREAADAGISFLASVLV